MLILQQRKWNQPKVILVAIVEQMILISDHKTYILDLQIKQQKTYAATTQSLLNCCFWYLHISITYELRPFALIHTTKIVCVHCYRKRIFVISILDLNTNLINPTTDDNLRQKQQHLLYMCYQVNTSNENKQKSLVALQYSNLMRNSLLNDYFKLKLYWNKKKTNLLYYEAKQHKWESKAKFIKCKTEVMNWWKLKQTKTCHTGESREMNIHESLKLIVIWNYWSKKKKKSMKQNDRIVTNQNKTKLLVKCG